MPPFSRTIEEEGALFDLFQLVTANEFHEQELRDKLGRGVIRRGTPTRTSPIYGRNSLLTRGA